MCFIFSCQMIWELPIIIVPLVTFQPPPSSRLFFFLFFLHLQDDRSLINLHLMHTSYFLFVMVITMFCYAVIKGRPGKVRQTNVDYCPEKVQRPWRHTRQVKVARWPPAVTAKAIPSVAGGAVRGLASRSPRAVSELWHGLNGRERGEKKKKIPVAYWTLGIQ